MYKKIILFFIVISITLTGCFQWNSIRGSGDIEEDYRSVDEFEEIEISGAYSMRVSVGESPMLKVSGDDNLLKYVRTRVRGNKLIIDTRKEIKPRNKIRIIVSTDYLDRLESSGANNVKVRGIKSDRFKLDISGACTVILSGDVDLLDADISGATNIDAEELYANKVRIDCSGASHAEVYAREYLSADASGVSKISFHGNPENVHSDASGISSIRRR